MKLSFCFLLFCALPSACAQTAPPSVHLEREQSFLGFDRNDYPGDANLKALRRNFFYAGYWLNNPPGAKTNTWKGKRQTVEQADFGFLVLFNGRSYAEIKSQNANRLGTADAATAIFSARSEGFPAHTVIFLDQEEGGRLLQEQRDYLLAWIDAVIAGGFEAGVYCSGIAAKEGSGVSVVTAEDIQQHAGSRKIKYWIVNDSCPPSPGCSVARKPSLDAAGIPFAEVWQYAQSPRRPDFAANCRSTYNRDNNCYAESVAGDSVIKNSSSIHLDLDVSASRDPSNGRRAGN